MMADDHDPDGTPNSEWKGVEEHMTDTPGDLTPAERAEWEREINALVDRLMLEMGTTHPSSRIRGSPPSCVNKPWLWHGSTDLGARTSGSKPGSASRIRNSKSSIAFGTSCVGWSWQVRPRTPI
jgi:hypothetical protein